VTGFIPKSATPFATSLNFKKSSAVASPRPTRFSKRRSDVIRGLTAPQMILRMLGQQTLVLGLNLLARLLCLSFSLANGRLCYLTCTEVPEATPIAADPSVVEISVQSATQSPTLSVEAPLDLDREVSLRPAPAGLFFRLIA
jgi:hypothetical protein